MKRNFDAQQLVKMDRRSSLKSRYMILDDFFSETQPINLQGSSTRSPQQQKLLTDPAGRRRKKKVRFVVRRNKAYPPIPPSQTHWTPAYRQGMISEQSREAKTIVQEERSWGHLPNLLKQIHIESYFPRVSVGADPILTHLYRHEPERLLGIERLHAPWRRSRDCWNAEAAANYALRLGMSLAEALNDDNQCIEKDDPMLVENWGESLNRPEYPLSPSSPRQSGSWI